MPPEPAIIKGMVLRASRYVVFSYIPYYISGYEELCFKVRGNPNVLVVEGFCVICKLYFPIGVDLLDYRERMIEDRNEMLDSITRSCIRCNTPNALLIPNLLYE
jgi:hypothetical protein